MKKFVSFLNMWFVRLVLVFVYFLGVGFSFLLLSAVKATGSVLHRKRAVGWEEPCRPDLRRDYTSAY